MREKKKKKRDPVTRRGLGGRAVQVGCVYVSRARKLNGKNERGKEEIEFDAVSGISLFPKLPCNYYYCCCYYVRLGSLVESSLYSVRSTFHHSQPESSV